MYLANLANRTNLQRNDKRTGRMGSDTKLERIQARREEMAIKVKRMREGASGKEEWSEK